MLERYSLLKGRRGVEGVVGRRGVWRGWTGATKNRLLKNEKLGGDSDWWSVNFGTQLWGL